MKSFKNYFHSYTPWEMFIDLKWDPNPFQDTTRKWILTAPPANRSREMNVQRSIGMLWACMNSFPLQMFSINSKAQTSNIVTNTFSSMLSLNVYSCIICKIHTRKPLPAYLYLNMKTHLSTHRYLSGLKLENFIWIIYLYIFI